MDLSPDFENATYAKVTGRLIPFLFGCYILAYVDRVNVGFAKLQMQQDLGMTETVYGEGKGVPAAAASGGGGCQEER